MRPRLSATALNPTFTEAAGLGTQAAAVALFSGAADNTIEAGQTIIGLNFTVSGLLDGANESIVVDGSTITLGANSAGTTATNAMGYTVNIVAGTATVSLTSGAGVSSANIATLINGITYQNTNTDNPTAGNRVFTLTQIQDSGGTANGGADTTALAIASTVNVVAVNDAPTLTATALNPTFTEAAGLGTQAAAVALFSGAADSTIEAGQTIIGLNFTVSGLLDGANESIVVDGSDHHAGGQQLGHHRHQRDGLHGHHRGGHRHGELTRACWGVQCQHRHADQRHHLSEHQHRQSHCGQPRVHADPDPGQRRYGQRRSGHHGAGHCFHGERGAGQRCAHG